MCILLATTAHPRYDLILISNRDESFERKTGPTEWHNNGFELYPTDDALLKEGKDSCGTWFGINKDGKVASILNLRLFNETIRMKQEPIKSRGMVPVSFLSKRDSSFDDWDSYSKFRKQYEYLDNTGEFNLFYGDVSTGSYRIIDSVGHTFVVLNNKEEGGYLVISNDLYREQELQHSPWGKIRLAKNGLHDLVDTTKDEDENTILARCFSLASRSTFDMKNGEKHEPINPLKVAMNTIFTPPLKVSSPKEVGCSLSSGRYYGTRSQIVVLIGRGNKRAKYIERTLHTSDIDCDIYNPDHPKSESSFDFWIN